MALDDDWMPLRHTTSTPKPPGDQNDIVYFRSFMKWSIIRPAMGRSYHNDDDEATAELEGYGETTTTTTQSLRRLEELATASRKTSPRRFYNWKEFAPEGCWDFFRWLAVGASPKTSQTDEQLQLNLACLARLLMLLREYEERFGMPEQGGPRDQEDVLREVCKDLYKGGAPIWALDPVMAKVAEGLTGKRGVDFFLLPRKAFIFAPSSGATTMFRTERGFCINKLDAMERIAVRLASFATNTRGINSLPARLPRPVELRTAFRTESVVAFHRGLEKEQLAKEILTLASDAEGLFFYINSQQADTLSQSNSDNGNAHPMDSFWKVNDSSSELFSRLATIEAIASIDKMDAESKELYSKMVSTILAKCVALKVFL